MTLSRIWPQALPFAEVVNRSRALLGRPVADGLIDAEARALFELLLKSYAPGLATLHLSPPRFSPRAGDRPLAGSLARWQARSGGRVTNLCHAPVVLEDSAGRHLLTLLDGTRDRAALVREMRAFIEANRGQPPRGETSAIADPTDEELLKNLGKTLDVFARCALLNS